MIPSLFGRIALFGFPYEASLLQILDDPARMLPEKIAAFTVLRLSETVVKNGIPFHAFEDIFENKEDVKFQWQFKIGMGSECYVVHISVFTGTRIIVRTVLPQVLMDMIDYKNNWVYLNPDGTQSPIELTYLPATAMFLKHMFETPDEMVSRLGELILTCGLYHATASQGNQEKCQTCPQQLACLSAHG